MCPQTAENTDCAAAIRILFYSSFVLLLTGFTVEKHKRSQLKQEEIYRGKGCVDHIAALL